MSHKITPHLTIDDLYDLDPVMKVTTYLDERDRAGVVHRNVDVVYGRDDARYAVTTVDLRRLLDEVTTLRREVLALESDVEELEGLVDNIYDDGDEGN